jgi:hypothetical protein
VKIPTLFIRLALAFAVALPAAAQTPAPPPSTISVFLDCGYRCDEDYLRTEITYVDWVRDRAVADVHLLVSSQGTGGGGDEFTLTFIGLRRFAGLTDTLKYVSQNSATQDERRKGMGAVIKSGLVRYVARTTNADRLQISMKKSDQPAGKQASTTDPWDFWVFRTSFNGFLNGSANNTFKNLNGSFNAGRTTDLWKVNLNVRENYNQSDFTIDDATSTFIRRSYTFSQLAVRSLGPRLAAGWKSSVGSSTFDNKKFSYRITPAVEYDIYPYSESTRRMFTVQYGIGYEGFKYRDTTIYFRIDDHHPLHTLAFQLSQTQPWGSVNVGLEGGQYLDMTNRNYAQLGGGLNIRLFKGFNVNFDGEYEAIRNQLYLPAQGATKDEILTQQRQLATNYQYFFFVGINYTFGSVLNNIVNPRFGRDF